MSGVNKVILVGSIGRDPEVKKTSGGKTVASLSLATNESWKDGKGERQERTEWHRVVLFEKLAEIAERYVSKGSQVYIEGKLQTRKWSDKDGVERYTTEIVGSSLQLLGPKPEGKQEERKGNSRPQHDLPDDEIPW